MAIQITSGSFTAVTKGTESRGLFTTNYVGDLTDDMLILEYSADGITWDLNNPPTILGSELTQTVRQKTAGALYVAEVRLTPTQVGQAVIYMRARLFNDDGFQSPGPAFAAVVTCYEGTETLPLMTVEVGTSSSGPWTGIEATLSGAVTSDGGYAAAFSTTARYVRVNNSTVVDRSSSVLGSVVIKWDSAGVYQWRAFGPSNVLATVTQLIADNQGIFFVGQWDKAAKTLRSSNDSTYSVPAVSTGQAWLVARLSNTGVWLGHTSIRKSTTTNSPQVSVHMGVGGNRLAIGIWVNGASGTVTYGANDQSFTWSGFSTSVSFHPAFVTLDTTNLNGAFGGGATNVGTQAYGQATASPDGHVAYAFNDGSSSSNRSIKVRVHDSTGTMVSSGTISTPGRAPFTSPSLALDDERVFVTNTAPGTGTQSWSINGHSRTFTAPSAVTFAMWRDDLTVNWSELWTPRDGVGSAGVSISTGAELLHVVSGTANAFDATNGDFLWDVVTTKPDSSPATNTLGRPAMDAAGTHFVISTRHTSSTGQFTATDDEGFQVVIGATEAAVIVVSRSGQLLKRAGAALPTAGPPSEPISIDWPVLDLVEGATFTATVFGFDPESSTGTAILQVWDQRKDDWIDNPTAFTPVINGAYPATLNVTMGADILTGATVVVTPVTGFNGEMSVLFRWKIVDGPEQTRIGPATEFVATWLSDAPSAPVGFAPPLFEEVASTMTVTWTDLDETGGASGKYELYAAELQADGENWRPKSWTKLGKKNTDEVSIEVASLSTTALEATLTITPKKNKSGVYRFALKVKETTGDKQESDYTIFEETITDLPDIPEIDGRFDVVDPDGDSWDLELGLDPNGPWSDCITLPDGTKLCVNGNEVEVVERGTGNRVVYYIRAKDSTGQVSQPKRVVAFLGNGATGAYPQRIIRDGAGVVTGVEPMFFLFGITALRFEEGLDGVGYAEVSVASDQLKRRAQENNTSITGLLDPMSVELVVTYKGTPVFVGPITEVEWETGSATTYITARGLLSYFEKRIIKVDTEYEPADLSDIAATMAAQSQGEPWGGLAIGTDTTDCGTVGTVPLAAGTSVLDALNAASEKLDGPEIWVDPVTRTLKAYPTRGTDRRAKVRLTSAMTDVAELKVREETLVTVARVVGGDNGAGGNFEAVYASPTRLAIYGRVERNYSAPQLMTNAECAAVAQRIVLARHSTTPSLVLDVTITPQRTFDLLDLGIGDVVTVDVEDPQFGRILGDYRIVNRAADLVDQADGTYRIRLNVEPALYVDGKLVGSRSRFNPAVTTELVGLSVNDRRG